MAKKSKVTFEISNSEVENKEKGVEQKLAKFERLEKKVLQNESSTKEYEYEEFGEKNQGKNITIYFNGKLMERMESAFSHIENEMKTNPELQKRFRAKRGFSTSVFVKKAVIEMLESLKM